MDGGDKMIQKELARLVIKFENWQVDEKENPTLMVSVYTEQGDYIGSFDNMTMGLLSKYGILPEKAEPSNNVCSIGKSLKNGKWYGWSHRAICGFSIGDTVKDGDCCASPGVTDEYLKDHPEADLSLPIGFVAKTEEDCKRMAIAFADNVS
jgi:hypothetical protein